MMAGLLSGLIATTLIGCASSHVVENAYVAAERYPMSQRPAYYQQLRDSGKLNKEQYAKLIQVWEKMNADQQSQEILFAKMTPAERATAWQNQPAAPSQPGQAAWTVQTTSDSAPSTGLPPVNPPLTAPQAGTPANSTP